MRASWLPVTQRRARSALPLWVLRAIWKLREAACPACWCVPSMVRLLHPIHDI